MCNLNKLGNLIKTENRIDMLRAIGHGCTKGMYEVIFKLRKL